ncbi:valacyclovir hydrolase-like [Zerene cesonia]|uniref:valacyclovir hydrolase-like n=1 Tax=Zerene cesonia TaxID=33412 RepID=UPI0018E51213|nr:valacyclovir hydrolase-like [Zerene cesonia]
MLVTRIIRTTDVMQECKAFLSTLVPKEEIIKIGSYNINCLKIGHGRKHVLCTQGALGSIWTDFIYQINGFDKDKFTIVFWDQPGFGKSRPPDRDFSKKLYNNDAKVSYQLMKELNIPRYSLLGWSNGSVTCMIHAANHPDKVEKLVIWGANSFVLPKEVIHYKEMKDVSLWSKKMKKPMVDLYGEELFARYWAQWVDSMIELVKDRNGDICSNILPKITCPTFILYGEQDPLVDRMHLTYLQTHIKNTKTYLYPGGKHNIHIRYHEDFNRRVQEFLLT